MQTTLTKIRSYALAFYLLGLAGCAANPPLVDIGAQAQLDRIRVDEARHGLAELRVEPDDDAVRFERAKLWYTIAEVDADNEALRNALAGFEQLADTPAFTAKRYRLAELKAYYGSAYALKARDFPAPWVIANLTPVGYIRIHYVFKGVSLMDQAVALDREHPVVRLMRGITCSNLPAAFGQTRKGLTDLQRLADWLAQPTANRRYRAILDDAYFRVNAYYSIAMTMRAHGRAAETFFRKTIETAPGSPFARAAGEALHTNREDPP